MAYHYLERVENAVKHHQDWRQGECLNLIASENFSSALTRSMLATDLGNRYTAPDRFYRGSKFIDEVQAIAEELARKVFNARFADVRPLSGQVADLAVFAAFSRAGDKVVSVSPDVGGHPGIAHQGIGKLLGLKNLYFPYNAEAINIDAKESRRLLEAEKPRVVVFGSSFIPFPQPVRQVSDSAGDGVCVYDASHVLGLIAGGEFQDPLREGCSLLIGSTHKSFPGPQGGLILANNEEIFKRVTDVMHPALVDNVHWNRVAALAVALAEMLHFGKAYASAVVKNAQTLAKSLSASGVGVRGVSHGYTGSHQVLLDYDRTKCELFAKRLEEANIIADNWGRIGVSEVTRLGMGAGEMEQVAELMSMVMLGKKPEDFVAKRVRSLMKDFKNPKFVLRTEP